MTATTVTGGRKLREFIRVARKGGIRGVEVGWVRSARYARSYTGIGGGRRGRRKNPPYAAAVAAWNEWGTRRFGRQYAPPRPFLRPAIIGVRPRIREVLRAYVDPARPVIDRRTGDLLGMTVQAEIRRRITDLRSPPNSPVTIRLKGGKTNPLVDSGFLRQTVIWRVLS